jgi:hypothetical protein
MGCCSDAYVTNSVVGISQLGKLRVSVAIRAQITKCIFATVE